MTGDDDDDEPDLFSAHTRARWGDPYTSHEAAEKILPKMTARRRRVLRIFHQYRQMTDLELEAMCKDHGSTFRTRRSELVLMGFIEDSGAWKIQNDTKRIVWRITPAGLAAASIMVD